MSYVIENFYQPLHVIRWNLRTKNLFFIRNTSRFVTFLLSFSSNFNMFYKPLPSLFLFKNLLRYFFARRFYSFLLHPETKQHPSHVTNIFKSFSYWALKLLLEKISYTNNLKIFKKLTYHYYFPKKTLSVPLNKHLYRKTIFIILQKLLLYW